MKYLAFSRHFQRQFDKLAEEEKAVVRSSLKELLEAIKTKQFPAGLGFKKINGDKFEIRVSIRLRVALKLDGETLVCHVVGNHESIKRYLRDYRAS